MVLRSETGWFIISILFLLIANNLHLSNAHEAKDFDDSILYEIEFVPFTPEEEVNNGSGILKEIYGQLNDKFLCHIPNVEEKKEEKNTSDRDLSPLSVLQPVFVTISCSFRLEAYWSYEICHGYHVRQYHEEREGKNMKFHEFYLGKWTNEKTVEMMKAWEEERKAGIKYKTTKIDNINYPYYEMEFTDGTMCDIINAPRSTLVRYVCYPHGKNEIYSFKEISSCRYEAIILTSVLCLIPAFHPEKSKELKIKCARTSKDGNKPINMLISDLREMAKLDADLPIQKSAKDAASILMHYKNGNSVSYSELLKRKLILDKIVMHFYHLTNPILTSNDPGEAPADIKKDYKDLVQFLYGKQCLTGVTGWWKYEFCFGRYVRQFHKDKNSGVELILGFFSEEAHKKWIFANPAKAPKFKGSSGYIWHHYQDGASCDRTNQRREVDVKLTCAPNANSPTSVSMYLLEPKTCVYILAVDSPIICDLMHFVDEFGLVQTHKLFGPKLDDTNNPDLLISDVTLTEKKDKKQETANSANDVDSTTSAPNTESNSVKKNNKVLEARVDTVDFGNVVV